MTSAKEITAVAEMYQERMRRGDKELKLPIISYYGTGRLWDRYREKKSDMFEKNNRKQVLQALIDNVRKKCGTGDISLYCRRKLEQIRDAGDPKMPYVGIMIWWLEKHT